VTGLPSLPAPFEWDGDHIAVQGPGGEALFMTRRTGLHPALGMRWADGHQVHENRVRRVTSRGDVDAPLGDYDGHATDQQGIACKVVTADCLPVALFSDGCVAMLHAGWRGLAMGVLEEGVAAMRELGAGDRIVAAIGPGAGVCCYEVGDEVLGAFADTRPAPAKIDLKAHAARRLAEAGVGEVHDVSLCTICTDPSLFHSYRRDRAPERQLSFAWRS
jgi:YfiH family protein